MSHLNSVGHVPVVDGDLQLPLTCLAGINCNTTNKIYVEKFLHSLHVPNWKLLRYTLYNIQFVTYTTITRNKAIIEEKDYVFKLFPKEVLILNSEVERESIKNIRPTSLKNFKFYNGSWWELKQLTWFDQKMTTESWNRLTIKLNGVLLKVNCRRNSVSHYVT